MDSSDFQANFWPYGVSYFSPPSGRFSDGRLIPDFIAEFAGLPLIPTYLDPRNDDFTYGANFASGGAGALVESHADLYVILLFASLILKHKLLVLFEDLEKQFTQNLGAAARNETQLVIRCPGTYLAVEADDYLSPVGINDSLLYPYTHEEYVGMVIGKLTNVNGQECQELGIIVSLHNHKLSKKLQELENQLEGFMYAKFDPFTEISQRITNPSKYGIFAELFVQLLSFKVGDTACCGSGPFGGICSCGGKRGVQEFELCDNISEYFFFDYNHNKRSCKFVQFARDVLER
ncbi:hypothetical protein Tco_1277386 [Tanacetum coccineum]